jgi:hypothetical protein
MEMLNLDKIEKVCIFFYKILLIFLFLFLIYFNFNHKGSSSGPEEIRYNPTLLSIRQEKDNGSVGLEISFRSDDKELNDYSIIITIYISNSPPSFIEIPMPRIDKRDKSLTFDSPQRKSDKNNSNDGETRPDIWHHIIIAHTPSTFRSKSEMSVLIDGNFSKHTISFPRFKDQILEPTIGDKSNKFSTENSCFCGQLGAIYFFSEPLTEHYMRGIHELGSGYSKLFSDRDSSNTREGKAGIEIKQQSKALNGTLTPLIMLAYNPGVWKGNFAVDVTPEKNQTRWRPPKASSANDSKGKDIEEYETFGNHGNSYSHARCLSGTYRSTTKDMRDALDCLGGIKVLLPLFAQFDLPILNSDSKNSSFDENICLSIWKLIFSMLRDSSENHRLMDVIEGNKTKGNGFKTISYFLERISPNHLKIDVFYLLIDKTKQLAEINLVWQDSFIKYILCNFKIWIFTSYLVQRDLMRFLIEFVQDNPKRGLEILPVQTLMNILHQWYNQSSLDKIFDGKSSVTLFDRNNETTSQRPRSIRIDKDKKGNYYRLAEDELMVIRSNFFQLIYMQLSSLAKDSSNIVDEIEIIIREITNETTPKYKIECLQLILRIVNPEKEKLGDKVLYALGIKNCINDIVSLLSHSNGKLRLYSHIVLCTIIQFALHRGPLPASTLRSPKKDTNNMNSSQSQVVSLSESTITSQSLSEPNGRLFEDAPRLTNQSIRPTNSQLSSLISSSKASTKEVKDIFDTIGIPFPTIGFFFAWMVNSNITSMKSSFVSTDTHDQQCQIMFKSLVLTMQGQICKYLVNDVELIFKVDNNPNNEDQSEIPYLRQSSYEIRSEFNEKSKDLQICLPVLWTTLIDFIENDIITSSRRLKFISTLKSIFDGFSNFEAILSVPCWQECYIRLFVNEMKNIDIIKKKETDLLFSKSANSELSENKFNCQGIFDIAINMICDLHYHCIEIGMSGISNMISSPKDVVRIDLNTMDWAEFVNILKIRDIVGTQKLRETMTHVRCSGLQDSHNISNQLCCLLLQQTITRIKLEDSKLTNIEQDEGVKNVRTRMMSLNQWLTAMEVLEFLSFPPIQQSPSPQSDNASLNSPRMMRGISAPERIDRNRINSLSENISGSMNTDDSDTLLDDSCIGDNFDDPFLNLDNIERNRRFSFGNDDSIKLSIPHVSSLKSVNSSNSLSSSNSPQLMRSVSSPDSIYDNEFSRNSTHISSGSLERSDSDLFNDEAYCHELDKFNLIESIMNLIGPLENYASVWDPSTNRMERIKMGMKVGFMFSRSVLIQVTESVDSLVTPTSASSTSSTNKQGQGPKVMGGALSKCIDRVLWNLLRVLLNIFLSGGNSDNSNRAETVNSPHILACNRIMTLLDFLMNRAREYYDSESLYVTACVSLVLMKTERPINSLWTKYAFKLISNLLVMRRDYILVRLSEVLSASNNNDVPLSHTLQLKETQSEALLSPQLLVEQTLLKEEVVGLHSKIDTICESTSELLPTSEVALAVIRFSLIGSSGTDFSEIVSSLTLAVWKLFIDPISEEGKKIEKDILSSRLTEFGLHKPSHDLSQILDKQKTLQQNYFNDMQVNIEKSINNSKLAEVNHFKFQCRFEESQRRRNAMNWNSILEELANERGPWGVGVDEAADVFWMIDLAEDDLRAKRKTRRNPRGCRHESASFLTSSIFESCDISFNKQSEEKNEVKDEILEENNEFIKSDSFVNPELWRDLMKYQSKNSSNKDKSLHMSTDESDNDDDLSVELDEDINEDGEQIQSSIGSSNILFPGVNSSSTPKVVNASGITDIYDGDVPKSKLLYRSDCEIITSSSNSLSVPSSGTLEVTLTKILFTRTTVEYPGIARRASQMNQISNKETSWVCTPFLTTQWDPIEVSNVLQRYYQLRFVGVEVFFINRQSVFINLYEVDKATLFLKVIRQKLKPINIKPNLGRVPSVIIQRANIPESLQPTLALSWANREISNFEYLSKLNTYAGRTFNDLGQYPVFPWVLKDYTSKTLDLKDPESYRDLAWPIGAQNINQREHVASSFEDLNCIYEEDEKDNYSMPPFHFGSHYSVAGFVLWYLMRVEPFTSLHIQLQDGKFDKSDRLFHSIAAAYIGCTTNQSDVKELIPEMFYCPEILQNINKIDLGKKQNGKIYNLYYYSYLLSKFPHK